VVERPRVHRAKHPNVEAIVRAMPALQRSIYWTFWAWGSMPQFMLCLLRGKKNGKIAADLYRTEVGGEVF
jgi:hypothetical protein